ncbi:MAG: heterodisulfide reductase subunit C [Ignavibacteria bacterium]|jgi:heterodisulfide reductase subunit C|nr:heterodisulfide reductase subunit C [Ignavibacteria bacterium]MCU7503496.1 heterodisulfide reductase subunit C [Ignavibacteria bacterium]MCU7516172.1 heterodisulfide reductase subunit C [Ignavibacteria bacterium]
MQLKLDNNVNQFANEIEHLSGCSISDCYQCGKCSAGCPVGEFVEESPTRLMRLIQLNQRQAVLNSKTPYLCATCTTCSERCPMKIDVAKVMETIRILACKEGLRPAVKAVSNFSGAFLDSVKSNGRLFEFGMTVTFNLKNGTPFKNATIAPAMLLKGKLSFLPQSIKNKERLKNIFANSSYFEDREEKKEH